MAHVDHNRVRELAALRWTDEQIAQAVGCSTGYARGVRTGKFRRRADGGSSQSRISPQSLAGKPARIIAFDNEALMDGRTIYPSTVRPVGSDSVLKSGFNSAKIGSEITKGRWKGFSIYTLTLEERATCPTSCKHWRSCFGNQMQFAKRYQHGSTLEQHIEDEIAILSRKHRNGFAVRLHVLGDFYSVEYVKMWSRLLDKHPQLHAFGFSARWEYKSDPIARALIDLVTKQWSRFAVRMSNAPIDACATVSIEHPYQKPDDAIICPQQLGKTDACATCALCWQSQKRIAFIQH